MLFGKKRNGGADAFPREKISEEAVRRFLEWHKKAGHLKRARHAEPYFVHLLSQTLPYHTPGRSSFPLSYLACTLDEAKAPARWTEDMGLVRAFADIGLAQGFVTTLGEGDSATVGRCWEIAPIWYSPEGPLEVALPPGVERATAPEVLARLEKIDYAARWISGEDLGFIAKNMSDWRKNATEEQVNIIRRDFFIP